MERDRDDFPEPLPPLWAVWRWPRTLLWCLAFLMVVSFVVQFDTLYHQRKISARKAKIDAACRGPFNRLPFPTKDWERRLQDMQAGIADADLPERQTRFLFPKSDSRRVGRGL